MIVLMRIFLISLLAVLPPVAAAAGKYGWFNDPLTGDSAASNPSSVGMDVYRSVDDVEAEVAILSGHKISFFGDYATRGARAIDENDGMPTRRLANFGVRWQHRVSAKDSVSILAEQGESSLVRPTPSTNGDTRATVAWTRELPWAGKPSITGGVFLGDDSARDESSRSLGRRYYGFSVGGELRMLESHRPYVSFRMQRSLYEVPGAADDGMLPGAPRSTVTATGDYSRLAAGWRWQASRGLSLQAEASYGMNFNNNPDVSVPLERERSRVFFGTRFDFR